MARALAESPSVRIRDKSAVFGVFRPCVAGVGEFGHPRETIAFSTVGLLDLLFSFEHRPVRVCSITADLATVQDN